MKKTLLFAGIATGAFLLTACGQMEKNSATEPPVKAENKETKQSATQIANQANRVIVDLVAKESRQESRGLHCRFGHTEGRFQVRKFG
ncbi:hypothetical protein P4S93_02190 [Aneurinibacillus thermoaerophilus]|uniref:hypothetical protein n=1 Tax=Aneurinibacillus thermoaerophilus TaxID=143495 RepID=UPI002E1E62C1|nr:hypothetical protein [Aneurinibacillus thermoaerophilus]MED0759595.1 hypothetical protein [Aneurinibacillus thermoaerophilus]